MTSLNLFTETDQQLAERIANADRYTSEADTKLRKEDRNLQDQDEDLAAMRKRQDDLNKQHGQLEAEKRVGNSEQSHRCFAHLRSSATR